MCEQTESSVFVVCVAVFMVFFCVSVSYVVLRLVIVLHDELSAVEIQVCMWNMRSQEMLGVIAVDPCVPHMVRIECACTVRCLEEYDRAVDRCVGRALRMWRGYDVCVCARLLSC